MKYKYLIWLVIYMFVRPVHAASCPEMERYTVKVDGKAKVHNIDLGSHPRAKEYRVQLQRTIGQPANFSGHYVLLTWGCGSPCHEIALVDVRNGHVSFAPFYGRINEKFRANSNLLILNDPPTSMFETEYYEWTGKEFREIKCAADVP